MSDSLVSFQAMEEGLNERNVVAKVLSDPRGPGPHRPAAQGGQGGRQGAAGLHRPLPARGAPSLLARRPAPPAEVADPGSAG